MCRLRGEHCTSPVTKNGPARTIPLSSGASAILRTLSDSGASGRARILPITQDAAKMAWKRLVRCAGLLNLRFHDLRQTNQVKHSHKISKKSLISASKKSDAKAVAVAPAQPQ